MMILRKLRLLTSITLILLSLLVAAGCVGESEVPAQCMTTEALTVYERRIEPLVNGSKVSSCNQCHLAGMDLSMYVRDTPCHTMGCLIANDLVDLDDPPSSKVLQQILKAEPTSELITSEVVQAEHDGFLEWIEHSAQCYGATCAHTTNPCESPAPTGEIAPETITPLGGCSEDKIIDTFDELIFEWRGRCHGCHTNCVDSKLNAPCWLIDEFDKEQPGGKREAAMLTMYNLIGLGVINTDDPLQSMMLLKPLDENLGGVAHGGGAKMSTIADPAYQDYKSWLEIYAACFNEATIEKPTVSILTPEYGHQYQWDEGIILNGMAVDPQDGRLGDDALVWTLHETDEVLGVGAWLYLEPLPPGRPIVTLTAVDSDGNKETRSTRLKVKAPPEPEDE